MTLNVESGTGLPDADSYASVADCQAYAAAHGLEFEGDDAALEAALRNATVYLDTEYSFKGERADAAQALEWPRVNAGAPPDVVPSQVVSACCELAVRALAGPLRQDISSTAAGAVTETTVGPITKRYAAAAGARVDGQTQFAAVNALLRRWLSSYGSSVKLVRY